MRWSMKKHNKLKPKIPAVMWEGIKFNVSELTTPRFMDRHVSYVVEADKARNESLNMRASRLMGMIAS